MGLGLPDLVQTARLTLQDPRRAARVVIGWPFSRSDLWLVLALMAVMAALLAEGFLRLTPSSGDPLLDAVRASPLWFALMQFLGLVLIVTLIFAVGRMAGGRGGFDQTMALVGWLQVILLALQVAQIVAAVLLPPLALLIGVGSLVITLWLLTSFTAELHGFTSSIRVFLAIVATGFAFVILLALVLVLVFGVGV